MDAARQLFDEVGFEKTTVRMIAKRAGVSLGGVFTTFESKADILVEIVSERRAAMIEEMEGRVLAMDGSVLDRILLVFVTGHRETFPNAQLRMAYLGASFSWSHNTERTNFELQARMGALMGRLLQEGVERGEIRADLDLFLFLRTILSLNLTNFRLAYYGGWTVEEMDDVLRRQLEMMFEGARPR